jgi:hypothetical protein
LCGGVVVGVVGVVKIWIKREKLYFVVLDNPGVVWG